MDSNLTEAMYLANKYAAMAEIAETIVIGIVLVVFFISMAYTQ